MQFSHISADEAREVSGARAENFSGAVRLQPITADPSPVGVEILAVFFPPGGRTRPHTHPVEQSLHVIEGTGVVAVEGQRWLINPGDVVVIPAGIWHWHGATPDSAMCHISIKQPGESDWNQPEKDWDEYMGDLS